MRARHRNSGGSCKLPGEVGSPHKRGGSVHPKHLHGEGSEANHRADRRARGGKAKRRADGGELTNQQLIGPQGAMGQIGSETPDMRKDQIDPQTGKPYGGRARGGKLTTKARQHLPKKDFALPGKGSGPKGAGSGSYPIPDKSHARNALARVSQHGSSEQKAKVRAAVHRKFPGIGEK